MKLVLSVLIGLALGTWLDIYLGFPKSIYVILAFGFALSLGKILEEWDKDK